MANAPTQATPATAPNPDTATPAPARAAPASSAAGTTDAPASGTSANTAADAATNKKPAAADAPAKTLLGGMGEDAVKLQESGLTKRIRAILGDTSYEVAKKVIMWGKTLLSDFWDSHRIHMDSMNMILKHIFRWITGGELIRKPLRAIKNFVVNRLKRARDGVTGKKDGIAGQRNTVPGVSPTGSGPLPNLLQPESPLAGLSIKSIRHPFKAAAQIGRAATEFRERYVGHIRGSQTSAPKAPRHSS